MISLRLPTKATFRLTMLHKISPASGSRKSRRRVGRGSSSGSGTTAGRGTKGQHSRTGKGRRAGFEGGQKPLIVRQPKLGGFINPNHKEYEPVNLETIEALLEPGSYDVEALRARKIIRTRKLVKVLSQGTVSKKFTLSVHAVSKKAKEAIEKAGGSVILLS